MGQQNLIGNISVDMSEAAFEQLRSEAKTAFFDNQVGHLFSTMQQYFGTEKYSFKNLFRDEKRKILRSIAKSNMGQTDPILHEVYRENFQLVSEMVESGIPVPKSFYNLANFVVNAQLHKFFTKTKLEIKTLKRVSYEMKKWGVDLGDAKSFQLVASERMYYEIKVISFNETSTKQLEILNAIFIILNEMGIELHIWKSQNVYISIAKPYLLGEREFPNEEWKQAFFKLGDWLEVNVGALVSVNV